MASPYAPLILEPARNAFVALDKGWTYRWEFQHPNPGAVQGGFSFRSKDTSQTEAEWLYWTGSTWTNVPSWINTSLEEFTDPRGIYGDGIRYQFQIATRDTQGNGVDDPAWSPAQVFLVVISPQVYLNSPVDIIAISRPVVSWEMTTNTEEQFQKAYRFVMKPGEDFDSTQWTEDNWKDNALGYVDWTYSSTVSSFELPFDVEPGTDYTSYIQVMDAGGLLSNWSSQVATASFELPAAPAVSVTVLPDEGVASISAEGTFNLLSQDGSDFSGVNPGGWYAYLNCAVTVGGGELIITASPTF